MSVALCSTLLTGCGDKSDATEIVLTTDFNDDEIFRIDSQSCTVPEVNIYMYTSKDQYQNIFGSEIWEQDLGGTTLMDELKDITLARLAQIKAMNLLGEERQIELSDSEKEKAKEAAKEFMAGLDPSAIALLGVNEELVENMYAQYLMAEKVYDDITADVNPEISDDEARTIKVKQILLKTYEEDENGNRTEFDTDRRNEVYKKALKIHSKAMAEDADFDALINEYNQGDEWEYTFGKGDMPQAYEEAAFNLDKDEISNVVQTDYGYHIIKCISNFDKDETDANKARIVAKRKKEAFSKVYEDFIRTLHSSLNEELWDKLEFEVKDEIETVNFFDVYNSVFKSKG